VGEKRKDVPVHFIHPWHECTGLSKKSAVSNSVKAQNMCHYSIDKCR
jgi:hypothetical protein